MIYMIPKQYHSRSYIWQECHIDSCAKNNKSWRDRGKQKADTRPYGANCAFEIALSEAIMLTLLFVCAFFSTQVQKYLAWGL